MFIRLIKFTALPLAIGLVFIFCQQQKKEADTTSPIQKEEIIPVKLAPVGVLNASDKIYASGLVFSDQEARLSFKTGGIIQRILADEGAAVGAGQVLAKLDLTEIDASVTQAKFAFDKTNRDLTRAKNLLADSVATKEQVQNAQTMVDLATENVRIAEFNRQFSEIRAPAAGRIIRKLMNEGELAGPGMPVFFLNLTGANNWVLRVGVADKDWAKAQIGDPASLLFDAYPGENFSATVSNKAEAADPTSGNFQLELRVNPQGKKLASGLFAKAEIQPRTSASFKTVPVEALHEGGGKQAFVFISTDGSSVQRLPVTIAFIAKDFVAISKGLENVAEVITAGSPFLTQKSKIQVVR